MVVPDVPKGETAEQWLWWFSAGQQLRKILPPGFPTIVTLCGSTRFGDAFRDALRDETLAGKIVLSVGLLGHAEGIDMDGPVKQMLDELHKRKIDVADEILVLNCKRPRCPECKTWWDWHPPPGNIAGWWQWTCECFDDYPAGKARPREDVPYVGSSTRGEIEYARAHGKVVRYLEQP
jgi:hypothetical protein